jgi:hypothetical protein
MKKNVFIVLWFLLIGPKVFSQTSDSTQTKANSSNLKIFLQGVGDWENYVKVSLWYVDYVRDPCLADVQIIVASQITGGGGSFYHLFFIGRGKYEGRNDTLTMNSPIEYTNKKTRDELTNIITMGLMPYLARNGQSKYMLFDFTDRQKLIQQSMDKWKNWIYTIQANGNFSGNKSTQIIAASANLSASHVTDKWKQKISGGISFNNNQYETSTYSLNGTTLIKNINLLAVKSYGEHFSAGLESGYYSSTFSNIKWQVSGAVGIEYDVFRYSESVTHLLTFKYRLQPFYNTYIDTTLYLRKNDFLFNHILDITFTQLAKWGNLSTTLTGSHFFNHPKNYRFDLTAQMNFRLARGLFFTVLGNAAFINNQFSIRKNALKPEEIILFQKEVLTSFSYGMQIGITYTFGSIYNNIVNPRYDGGVYIDKESITLEKTD